MSDDPRQHCRFPGACQAKGNGLCRPCTGALTLGRMNADPDWVRRRNAVAVAARDTEEHRAKLSERAKRTWRGPKMKAILRRNGRKTIAILAKNPDVQARRIAASHAGKERALARRYRVPLELLGELRNLRSRKFTLDEARAVLQRSHATAFSTWALHQVGPMPAAGDPARRAWAKRVNDLVEPRT